MRRISTATVYFILKTATEKCILSFQVERKAFSWGIEDMNPPLLKRFAFGNFFEIFLVNYPPPKRGGEKELPKLF